MASFPQGEEVSIHADILIQAVKDRPALYDKTHKQYNDRIVKGELWDQVGKILFPKRWNKWNKMERRTAVCYMQKRWSNLRTTFSREVKRRVKRREEGYTTPTETWIHYDSMMFMKDFMTVVIDGQTVTPNDVLADIDGSNDNNGAYEPEFTVKLEDDPDDFEVQYLEEEHLSDSDDYGDCDYNNEGSDNADEKVTPTEEGNESDDEEEPLNKVKDEKESNRKDINAFPILYQHLKNSNLDESFAGDSDDETPKKKKKLNVYGKFVDINSITRNSKKMRNVSSSSKSIPVTPAAVPVKDIKKLDHDINFAMSLVPLLKELSTSQKLQAQIEILSIFKKATESKD